MNLKNLIFVANSLSTDSSRQDTYCIPSFPLAEAMFSHVRAWRQGPRDLPPQLRPWCPHHGAAIHEHYEGRAAADFQFLLWNTGTSTVLRSLPILHTICLITKAGGLRRGQSTFSRTHARTHACSMHACMHARTRARTHIHHSVHLWYPHHTRHAHHTPTDKPPEPDSYSALTLPSLNTLSD
jgi:hypothetical protein